MFQSHAGMYVVGRQLISLGTVIVHDHHPGNKNDVSARVEITGMEKNFLVFWPLFPQW